MHILFRNVFLLVVLLSAPFLMSYSQSGGVLSGTLRDATTCEPIIGANVLIEGVNAGTSTDVEGNYIFPNLPEGTYKLVITFFSYATQKLDGVVVRSGKTTILHTDMQEDSQFFGQIVVLCEKPEDGKTTEER